MSFYQKYLKYKEKYLDLKKQFGGMSLEEINEALNRYRQALTIPGNPLIAEMERNQGIVELHNLLERKNQLNRMIITDPVHVEPYVYTPPAPTNPVSTTQSTNEINETIRRYNEANRALEVNVNESLDSIIGLLDGNRTELDRIKTRIAKLVIPDILEEEPDKSVPMILSEKATLSARIVQLETERSRLETARTNKSIVDEIRRNDLVMAIIKLRKDVNYLETIVNDLHRQIISPEPKNMQIFVKEGSGKTETLSVDARSSISYVKYLIVRVMNIPFSSQRLIFASRQLEDLRSLSDFGISQEGTIYVMRKNSPEIPETRVTI
jgi:hypothetical protein